MKQCQRRTAGSGGDWHASNPGPICKVQPALGSIQPDVSTWGHGPSMAKCRVFRGKPETSIFMWNVLILKPLNDSDQKSTPAAYTGVCTQVCLLTWSRLTLCDPSDYSPPGSSVPGIFQARILESVAISSSRGSSWLRDWTHIPCVSCLAGGFFTAESSGTPLSRWEAAICDLWLKSQTLPKGFHRTPDFWESWQDFWKRQLKK